MSYQDFYEDANATAALVINDDGENAGEPGGVTWTGDADNEYIFGTDWLDVLSGGDGNDVMYGFEGDDEIAGNNGVDRLFGDGGNDIIFVGDLSRKPFRWGRIFATKLYDMFLIIVVFVLKTNFTKC